MKLFCVLALLISTSMALKTMSSSYSETATCSECVLNGDKYCAESIYGQWTVSEKETYEGKCIETTENCN